MEACLLLELSRLWPIDDHHVDSLMDSLITHMLLLYIKTFYDVISFHQLEIY